jgi:hypothetical protein
VPKPTTAEIAERMVISWIERVDTPPMALADAVARYRILSAYYELEEARGRDTTAIAERCNRLYDSLVESATAFHEYQERRSVAPDKQLRRLARKAEARLTLREQWDRAIAEWRAQRGAAHA